MAILIFRTRANKTLILIFILFFTIANVVYQNQSLVIGIKEKPSLNDKNQEIKPEIGGNLETKSIPSTKRAEFDNDIGNPYDSFIVDNLSFVVGDSMGLAIFNITDDNNTVLLGQCLEGQSSSNVYVNNDYAYLGDYGFYVVDVSDPTNPIKTGELQFARNIYGIFVKDSYAYVSHKGYGISIINIDNPLAPTQTKYFTGIYANNVFVNGSYMYTAMDVNGLGVVNIEDINNPFIEYIYNSDGSANNIDIKDELIFLADGTNGLEILNASNPAAINRVGHLNTIGDNEDIEIAGNITYALCSTSFSVINTTNIFSPYELGDVYVISDSFAIHGNRAYLEAHYELNIYNLSDLTNPNYIKSINFGGEAEGVHKNDQFVFIEDGVEGLEIINVSDTYHPTKIGSVSSNNKRLNDAYVDNNYAFLVNSDKVRIYNISNITNPTLVGEIEETGAAIVVKDKYLYLATYNNFMIYDITNISDPQFKGMCDITPAGSDIEIKDNYAFVSCWDTGLKIVDISNKSDPILAKIFNEDSFYISSGVIIDNNLFYTGSRNFYTRIGLLNITDPLNPYEIKSYLIGPDFSHDLIVEDNIVYAANNFGVVILNNTTPDFTLIEQISCLAYGIVKHNSLIYTINSYDGLAIYAIDSDSDGLYDDEELYVFLTDPLNPDSDYDDLTDMEEVVLYCTDPNDNDTDDDLMPDGWEVDNDLLALIDDSEEDPDNDALTNIEEYNYGTDPQNADTDGDGFLDGDEIANGSDPLDPNNTPAVGVELFAYICLGTIALTTILFVYRRKKRS